MSSYQDSSDEQMGVLQVAYSTGGNFPSKYHYERGDVVTIYKNPYTQTEPEGKVALEKWIRATPFGDIWLVQFYDKDGHFTDRFEERIVNSKVHVPRW